ncbi:MAG: diguanylate cyclase [Gemmatimonadota bacterium]
MSHRTPALSHPSVVDADSGLANHLHFELVLHYLFHGADRGVPLTVATFQLPDVEGIAVKELGEKIRSSTRLTDVSAHLGGRRFSLLLLGTTLPGARIAVDRVEMALEALGLEGVGFGLAQYRTEMKDPADLLKAADSAMNAAQAAGGGVEMV